MTVDHVRSLEALSLFHGFSPVVGSLCIFSTAVSGSLLALSHSQLDYSFPLLDDLSVVAWPINVADISDSQPAFIQPSKPPVFTGTLELSFITGIDLIASTPLSLQSGPHFQRLGSTWCCDEDISLTAVLVERCHPILEHFSVFLIRLVRQFDIQARTGDLTLFCR